MSDQAQEQVEEPVEPVEPVDTDPSTEDEISQARSRGWMPADRYSGPEGKWRNAHDFLEVGTRIEQGYANKNKKLEHEIEELKAGMAKVRPFMEKAVAKAKAERDKVIDELKDVRKKAIEVGDGQAFEDADTELRRVESEKDEPTVTEDQIAEAEAGFKARNADFLSTPANEYIFLGIAGTINREMRESGNILTPQQFYAEVEKRGLALVSPEQGKSPRQTVESGTPSPRRSSGQTFNDLPADAKAQFKEFVEMDIFKDTDKDRREYSKLYEWEQ